MINLDHVSKTIGYQTVLSDLCFSISTGEFISIIGPNGAGKTSLLRLLATLSRPSQGEIKIGGFVLPQQAIQVRRLLAYLGHEAMLYGNLTAYENLNFFASIYEKPVGRTKIMDLLDQVGLSRRASDEVSTFSRGMKQRLKLLVALMSDAELLLLDEPHSGLDEEGRRFLDAALSNLHQRGHTILMVSHNAATIGQLSDRVLGLQKSKAAWVLPGDLAQPLENVGVKAP
jgi:heme exporter protein A